MARTIEHVEWYMDEQLTEIKDGNKRFVRWGTVEFENLDEAKQSIDGMKGDDGMGKAKSKSKAKGSKKQTSKKAPAKKKAAVKTKAAKVKAPAKKKVPAKSKTKKDQPVEIEYRGYTIREIGSKTKAGKAYVFDGRTFKKLEDARAAIDEELEQEPKTEAEAPSKVPEPGPPIREVWKELDRDSEARAKDGRNGQSIGLIDIYNVLCDIRDLLSGGKPTVRKATNGKKSMSKSEKAERKQQLLDGGPYSKKQLDEFKGTEIRMLASALGLKSFGINPGVLRLDIAKHYGKSSTTTTKTKKSSK